MKIQTTIAAGLVVILSLSVITTHAQSLGEPAVKILPSNQRGILKVLYAYDAAQSVNVKIFNNDGQVVSDEIKEGTFHNGFLKKYDVRNISKNDFWIQITTDNVSLTYRLVESRNGESFEPLLESTTYSHPLVASNN